MRTARDPYVDRHEIRGSATIWPTVARVGTCSSFVLTYTVGPPGMNQDQGVAILPPPWGAGRIQISDPKEPGYASVLTTGKARMVCDIECVRTWWYATPDGDKQREIWCELWLRIEEGRLEEGDVIEIRFRDLEAQFCSQKKKPWGVRFVTGKWNPRSNPIPQSGPLVSYVADVPSRFLVTAPSMITTEEYFELRISVLDAYLNSPDEPYQAEAAVSSSEPVFDNLPKYYTFTPRHGNRLSFSGVKSRKTGIYYIEVEGTTPYISCTSNPVKVCSGLDCHLFWGDMHVHTELSDGIGDPEETYQIARDVYHLDFCALTDHDLSAEKWSLAKRLSETYNSPGRFITFPAFEWTSEAYGHRNVYFRSEDSTIECPPIDHSYSVENLFSDLKSNCEGCIVIPHHSLWHMDFDYHDPELECLVEIYSVWGSSEYRNNHLRILADKQPGYIGNESVQEALTRGYRFGFTAGGDNHLQRGGDPYPDRKAKEDRQFIDVKRMYGPGKTAVFAKDLTRDAIWDSLVNRRCYATTGARIIVEFKINGEDMGSEVVTNRLPEAFISVAGTDTVRTIELIKNTEVLYTHHGSGRIEEMHFADKDFDRGACYYARVIQSDLETAWTSPIWVHEEQR